MKTFYTLAALIMASMISATPVAQPVENIPAKDAVAPARHWFYAVPAAEDEGSD
ncbi:predicted protein [Histoplasma mississippiense (nom. inval.)]|uniref:predicted protein n=1 Tax=Ajellomyces capsulatus (strain NAm1 / WU24) TaxID=2059318 RepID=UPI000157D36D|nr:predicted protein [Histoplasma mississippiense (nom. inval.)]EDN04509.1 predicted protein [Histoplasma mississippiense (nom. inval.)]